MHKYNILLPKNVTGIFTFGKRSSTFTIKYISGEPTVILNYESSLEDLSRWVTVKLNKEKNDGKLICPYCGEEIFERDMNMDHIVSRKYGGVSIPGIITTKNVGGKDIYIVEGNLTVSHCKCNCRKGYDSLETFVTCNEMKKEGVPQEEINDFLKEERERTVNTFIQNKTLLPEEMISEVPLSKIKVNGRKGVGKGYRNSSKYKAFSKQFKVMGVIGDTIILDQTLELIHGAVAYYTYRENGVSTVKCIVLRNVIFDYLRKRR